MGVATKPSNYVTCVCGRICKGKSAHQTHARACTQEQARSEAFIDAVQSGDWSAYCRTYAGTRYVR